MLWTSESLPNHCCLSLRPFHPIPNETHDQTPDKKYQTQLKTNLELFSSQKYDEDLQRSLNKSRKDIHLVWTWQLWPLDSWDEKAERQTSKKYLSEATSVHQWQQCSKLQRYDAAVRKNAVLLWLRYNQGDCFPHFSRMRDIFWVFLWNLLTWEREGYLQAIVAFNHAWCANYNSKKLRSQVFQFRRKLSEWKTRLQVSPSKRGRSGICCIRKKVRTRWIFFRSATMNEEAILRKKTIFHNMQTSGGNHWNAQVNCAPLMAFVLSSYPSLGWRLSKHTYQIYIPVARSCKWINWTPTLLDVPALGSACRWTLLLVTTVRSPRGYW